VVKQIHENDKFEAGAVGELKQVLQTMQGESDRDVQYHSYLALQALS
jgi:hypothetical protein